MTPHQNLSPKVAFNRAAKKGDLEEMRRLLSSCPEHLSPIGAVDLFCAFNEALRDNRMETAEFLLRETKLADCLPEEKLTEQAQNFGRTIKVPKVR